MKSVNLKEIAKIAPNLGFIELIRIFKLFGIELVFDVVKKKGKKK